MRIWSPATRTTPACVRETLDYVLRDMTDPAGGFYSTEDADSEGARRAVLHVDAGRDRRGARRRARGDVRPRVRCDATSAISKAATSSTCRRRSSSARRSSTATPDELAAELADSRAKLFAAREKRVRPGRDDKVIVAWNGLMIDAMARAGAALERTGVRRSRPPRRPSFILSECGATMADCSTPGATARRSSTPISTTTRRSPTRSSRLYEATFQRTLDRRSGAADGHRAREVRRSGRRRLLLHGHRSRAADHPHQGTDRQQHAERQRAGGNGACCGWASCSAAATIWTPPSERSPPRVPIMQRAPMAAGQMLLALDRYLGPAHELVLVGDMARDDTKQAIAAIHRRYLPRTVVRRARFDVDRSDRVALAASRRTLRRQGIARRPAGAVCLPELRLPGAGGRAWRQLKSQLDATCS